MSCDVLEVILLVQDAGEESMLSKNVKHVHVRLSTR